MTPEEIAAAAAAEAAAAAQKKKEEDDLAAEAAAEAEKNKDKDKPTPSDNEAKLLKEVMKLKDDAKKAKDDAARAKADAARFEGIDPEKAKKALEAQAAAERTDLERKGEYDRIIAQVNEAHAAELKKRDDAIAAEKAEAAKLQKHINSLTIGNSFKGSKFINDSLTLSAAKAEVLYGEHFDIEDGQLVPYDKPRGVAERTRLVNGQGVNLAFEDAIAKIVAADPDFEKMKKSAQKPGANSSADQKPEDEETNDDEGGLSRIIVGLKGRTK